MRVTKKSSIRTFAFRRPVTPLAIIETVSPGYTVKSVIPGTRVRDFAAQMRSSIRVLDRAVKNGLDFATVDICKGVKRSKGQKENEKTRRIRDREKGIL